MASMTRYNWASVEKERLNPLFFRQMIHGEKMTLARVELGRGCVVPEHAHANEQISIVLEGKLRFRIGGDDLTLEPGDVLHIPSEAPHSVTALEESVVMDVFSPVRDDWRRGNDAYLRR
jgi:quercetin dioxygenase-like cupin family protein